MGHRPPTSSQPIDQCAVRDRARVYGVGAALHAGGRHRHGRSSCRRGLGLGWCRPRSRIAAFRAGDGGRRAGVAGSDDRCCISARFERIHAVEIMPNEGRARSPSLQHPRALSTTALDSSFDMARCPHTTPKPRSTGAPRPRPRRAPAYDGVPDSPFDMASSVLNTLAGLSRRPECWNSGQLWRGGRGSGAARFAPHRALLSRTVRDPDLALVAQQAGRLL